MRAADTFTESLFTVRRLDDFVPQSHPLRPVRKMVNEALKNIEPLLSSMYAAGLGGEPQERHQPGVRGQHPVLGVIVLQGGQVFEIVDCFLHGINVEDDRSLCNDLVSSIAKNLFYDDFRR